MLKQTLFLLLTALFFACTNNTTAEKSTGEKQDTATNKAAPDTTKKSIPSETKKQIGGTEIKINYHAPAVRGRTIWGGLVAYDAVWVTGAHSATSIEVDKEFKIGDKQIAAGKYALFTIPGKEEWTVIINKNWKQHLADDYSEKEDVVRIKVKPQVNENLVERLNYGIEETGEKTGNIIISWEKIRVPFAFEVQ